MSAVPSFQFRGVFLPAKIVEKATKKEITLTELSLLLLIEAFVEKGKGCWASNGYLANLLETDPTFVSHKINDLVEKGLLIREERDGTRWLETCWSGEMERSDTPCQKTQGGCQKTQPPLVKKDNQNIRIEYKNKDVNLFTEKKRSPKSIDPKFLDWAKRLERVISQVYKLSPDFHLIKWARAFQSGLKQVQNDGNRIDSALDLLQKNGHSFVVTCPKLFFIQLPFIEQAERNRNLKKEREEKVIN
jgi:hypothetical protein